MHADPRQTATRRRFLGGAVFGGGLLLGGGAALLGTKGVAGGSGGGGPAPVVPSGEGTPGAEPNLRTVARPRKLVEGDVVRLVSPGGPPDHALVDGGVRMLEGWGLEVQIADHALGYDGYLSAPDGKRLADLNDALTDPEVRAVIATRGGYGTQRIVDGVDFAAVRADPKVVVGYSDITALHATLWRHASVATLHAPMAAWNVALNTAASADALHDALMSDKKVELKRDPDDPTASVKVPGKASGTLLGGNLSVLVAERTGLPDLTGAILFLEDVREEPYRIDGMITELLRVGALDGLAGIAIGQFHECVGGPGDWTVADVLTDRLGELGVPVLGGLPIGHGPGPLSMPLGTEAEIDVKAGTLTIEAAVTGLSVRRGATAATVVARSGHDEPRPRPFRRPSHLWETGAGARRRHPVLGHLPLRRRRDDQGDRRPGPPRAAPPRRRRQALR